MRTWHCITPSQTLLLASCLLTLSGILQLATAWLQARTKTTSCASHTKRDTIVEVDQAYSWIGDDFPNALPLQLDTVAMTIENSRHYSLNSPDSDAEYQSMYPGELGFLRLGPNRRFFGIAMYHQLHCLDSLRLSIVHGSDWKHHDARLKKRSQVPHVDHCLNYLRQTILCSADLTLEPEVVLGSQDVEEGLAVTHLCKDWSRVYEFAEENAEEWGKWKNATQAGLV